VCPAVTEIRRIAFEGSRPIGGVLVQMLEEKGVTVQLPGWHTSEYRDARDVASHVMPGMQDSSSLIAEYGPGRRLAGDHGVPPPLPRPTPPC
jgi:hypothetical protein